MLSKGLLIFGLLTWLFTNPSASPEDDIKAISDSGRCATVAETPDQRVAPPPLLPPGPPPMLSFRYYEGKAHSRLGNSDLMLDDAGH